MSDRIDIHNFKHKLCLMRSLVKNLGVSAQSLCRVPISKRNAELLLSYELMRSLEGLRPASLYGLLNRLLQISRMAHKDFDRMTRDDVKQVIGRVNDSPLSAWTKAKIRTDFKKFFMYVRYGDDYSVMTEYPEEVRWIKKGLKKLDQNKLKFSDCWSEEEIKKLLAAATHPRDQAIISVLTETGARVGELGALRVGDVYQDEFSYLIHLDGKTGERDSRVIYSSPRIAAWLNCHPYRDNPEAALFLRSDNHQPLMYEGLKAIIKKVARRAGIKLKRCNPHIYRHSRATILLTQGWPEPMVKEYMGWDKSSGMLSVYSHITSRQANNFLLKAHGVKTKESVETALKIQVCMTCAANNTPDSKFCSKCGRPLNTKTILRYNHEKNEGYKELNKFFSDPECIAAYKEALRKLLAKEQETKAA